MHHCIAFRTYILSLSTVLGNAKVFSPIDTATSVSSIRNDRRVNAYVTAVLRIALTLLTKAAISMHVAQRELFCSNGRVHRKEIPFTRFQTKVCEVEGAKSGQYVTTLQQILKSSKL